MGLKCRVEMHFYVQALRNTNTSNATSRPTTTGAGMLFVRSIRGSPPEQKNESSGHERLWCVEAQHVLRLAKIGYSVSFDVVVMERPAPNLSNR
jgi:hypothetical protein